METYDRIFQLRANQETFNMLVHDLRPLLEEIRTNTRPPLPVVKRVAVSLWQFFCDLLGLPSTSIFGQSIAHGTVKEFAQTLLMRLPPA